MKNLVLSFISLMLILQCRSQAAGTWSVKFSDAIISRWPTTINSMTGKGWEYSNTIITHGIEKVYNNVPTAAYLTYIKNYVDGYVNASGTISASMVSLDRVHPGISCLFLYEQLKSNTADSTRYRNAANTLRNLLVGPTSTYTKTSNGIFWHKLSGYDNIVMLDGVYMAHPFLVKYGRLFNDNAAIDTAVNQTLFVYSQLYDNTKHLIKHAWTSTPSAYSAWANASTGNSSEVWSRAMGWYMLALVDILKYLPASHPKRASLLTALTNLSLGIKNYQDPATGLWYQVVDKGLGQPGYTSANYIESSGSAMFVYAIKTAVDSGWISSASYLPVAQNGWTGLKNLEITIYSDSKPQINNFAPAMSYKNDYNGYVSVLPVDCPSTLNPHGYAAILMAASVMEFPLVILPVHFNSFSAKAFTDNTKLNWQNKEEGEVAYYIVQRSDDGSSFDDAATISVNFTGVYNWTDPSPLQGAVVYYRVQALTKDNKKYFTNTLTIKTNNTIGKMMVLPNPSNTESFTVGISHAVPGNYQIAVINSAGSTIYKRPVFAGTEPVLFQTVQLPSGTKPGLYIVQLSGAGRITNTAVMLH